MALGIGANTALFSVLDAVVLKSLPVRDPDRLVGLSLRNARGDRIIGFSYPLFSELRARNRALAGMVAISWADRLPLRLPPAAETETATVTMVSSDFFEVLGVQAQLGRALTAADDQPPGAHPVAVLSQRYWRSRFGSNPSVIGHTVLIQDVGVTVVGIAPPGFFGSMVGELPDLWVPAMLQPLLWPGRNFLAAANTDWLMLMGRLRTGVSRTQAQGDLERMFEQIQRDWQPTPMRQGKRNDGSAAGQPGILRVARAIRPAAPAPHGRGRAGAARGLRERGEPAFGAGRCTAARNRHPAGCRGQPPAPGRPVLDRDPLALASGWSGRSAAGFLGNRSPDSTAGRPQRLYRR
jgi:hypothetical protein